MIRALAGILAILVLYLAARNARLEDRQRILEAKLAASQARPKFPWKPAAASPPAAPDLAPSLPPAAAPSPVAQVPPSLERAASPESRLRLDVAMATQNSAVEVRQANLGILAARQQMSATFTLLPREDELGLSPSQKQAIDQLKVARDERTQTYQDAIGKIESETEDAIHQLLTPEQRQKYDGAGNVVALAQVESPSSEAPLPPGVNPGYLGISGEDAKGGGVRLGNVLENTVAAAAGLRPGDVILELNGEPMTTYAALASKIRSTGEGSPVVLRMLRGGSEFTQGLQLGPRPK